MIFFSIHNTSQATTTPPPVDNPPDEVTNNAPFGITLSNSSIQEGSASGTVIGTLVAMDPDVGDTFTYTLDTGYDATWGDRFAVVDDELQCGTTELVYDTTSGATNEYAVNVVVTDSGTPALTYTKTFFIQVTAEPATQPGGGGVDDPGPSGGAADTPSTTTPGLPFQEPTADNTGTTTDIGSLAAASGISTSSADPVYRSGTAIIFNQDGATLEGYDTSGYEIWWWADNCTLRNCYNNLSQGFATMVRSQVQTGGPGNKGKNCLIEYCTFDGDGRTTSEVLRVLDSGLDGWTIRYNKFINIPNDCLKIGDKGPWKLYGNYFWRVGTEAGAHPNPVHQERGLANSPPNYFCYNTVDQWGDGDVGGFDFLFRWQDFSGWNNWTIWRNVFKGGSRMFAFTPINSEFFENYCYLERGAPVYDGSGRDGYDGPFTNHPLFENAQTAADALVHHVYEARDMSPYTVEDKNVSGIGFANITNITTQGVITYTSASGATSHKYRYAVAGTGDFTDWLDCPASGGTLSLPSNKYLHVHVRGMNGTTRGPSSNTYLVNTGAVTVPVPVKSTDPVVSGTATQGQTLSCTTGTWTNSPTSFLYQWYADGVAISGATSSTFLLTGTQVGKVITCKVTARNLGGSSAQATSNSTSAVASDGSGGTVGNAFTWDATSKSDDMTISTQTITVATDANDFFKAARTTQAVTGKEYVEFTFTGISAPDAFKVGICTEAQGQGSLQGSEGWVYQADGDVWHDFGTSSMPTYTASDIVCLAIDHDNKKFWVRKGAAGNWNNSGTDNPATNTGGFNYATMASGHSIYLCTSMRAVGDSVTIKHTGLAGTVPSGFTAGSIS